MLINAIRDSVDVQIYIGLAILLLGGFIFAKYTPKFKLPKVTGYLLTGIILGPSVLNLFSEKTINNLEFIPYMTLGLIAVMIGAGLSFDLLKHIKMQLLAITIFEAFGALIFTTTILLLFGMDLGAVLPLAAVGCATAPAATIAIVKEYRAYGPFTNMVLGVVALDDAIAMIVFGFILSFDLNNSSLLGAGLPSFFHLFLFEMFNSILIGSLLAVAANIFMRRSRFIDNVVVIFGMVFLGIGISKIMHLSYLLTNMAFGFVLANISTKNIKSIQELEKFMPPIYCAFFVLAGTSLNLKVFTALGSTMLVWASLYIVFRSAGKMTGSYLGAFITKAPLKIRNYLGFTLIPQAGVAIGLTMLITEGSFYFPYKPIIINLILASVAVNEIIGPLLARFALFKAEEAVSPE
ncbi:cation:proton antiporter [Thermoproteota archaeon]